MPYTSKGLKNINNMLMGNNSPASRIPSIEKRKHLCEYHKSIHGYDKYFDEDDLDRYNGKWVCKHCEDILNMGVPAN